MTIDIKNRLTIDINDVNLELSVINNNVRLEQFKSFSFEDWAGYFNNFKTIEELEKNGFILYEDMKCWGVDTLTIRTMQLAAREIQVLLLAEKIRILERQLQANKSISEDRVAQAFSNYRAGSTSFKPFLESIYSFEKRKKDDANKTREALNAEKEKKREHIRLIRSGKLNSRSYKRIKPIGYRCNGEIPDYHINKANILFGAYLKGDLMIRKTKKFGYQVIDVGQNYRMVRKKPKGWVLMTHETYNTSILRE